VKADDDDGSNTFFLEQAHKATDSMKKIVLHMGPTHAHSDGLLQRKTRPLKVNCKVSSS
jgi:hypothetical protein